MEIIIIIILLLLFLFVTLILNQFNKQKIDKIIKEATYEVQNILNENNDSIKHELNPKLHSFYKELDQLKSNLKKNESTRLKVLNIVNSIAVNSELGFLFEDLMPKLLKVTDSMCGAFYIANSATNKLEIKSSLGFGKNIYKEFDMTIGEGIIGQAVTKKKIQIIKEIPEDTVYLFRTFVGIIKPKSIMVVPILNNDELLGVLLFASIYEYTDDQSEIIKLIQYYVGIAVGNGITFERSKRLTNELKFQNTLIQDLNEELEKKVENRTVFLNNIINSIKDYAIYATDKNGIVLAFNKGAEYILGYSQDEVIGRHVDAIHTEEEIALGITQKQMNLATQNGRYEESGWRQKKDGTTYYGEMVLFAMYEKNELNGFTNVLKDITYLKNVERALGFEKEFTRKMFEGSNEAILLCDKDGVIQIANKNAEELLDTKSLKNVNICNLFLDSDYLKKNLSDVATRFGRGEWRTTAKLTKTNIWFNVSSLMETPNTEPKLFIHLHL